jgi:hypothetical protein
MAYSDWRAFEGSSLLSFGRYNATERKLQLRLITGRNYEYSDVPDTFWHGLCLSDSKGAFFNKHIAGSFQFTELDSANRSSPVFIAPDRKKSKSLGTKAAPSAESYEDPQNTYIPPIKKRTASQRKESSWVSEVSEGQAHELINAGDFLGAVSIYEQLEEEVRKEGWGVHPSSEMICYFLYNQVVCLCWAGDYAWAARRAGKLAEYADNYLEDINSYEFLHSAIDCWVVRQIRAFLDGDAPEPELRLAVGALRGFNDGVSKPVGSAEATQGRGCIVILLVMPAVGALFFL